MRDPTKRGNLAYEAGVSAAESIHDRNDDSIDWSNPLDVEAAGEGFMDYLDEIVDMDAEDRRDA